MFANQCEQQRQAVIDIFKRYVKSREELRKNLNLSDGLNENDVKIVRDEVEKIEANKYILAIVGESKSGKSTFINALLGKPILPTGVLQCTSGITEIVDTDNVQDNKRVYLRVKYGNSTEPEELFNGRLEGDLTPLQEKLKTIAALKPEYRDLPVFQLNQFLTETKPTQITTEIVKEECGKLLQDEDNNPHHKSKEEFERLVRQYLAEYMDLSRIPVDISIGYPVGLKFAHIQIVDTPGVNARGGLETATLNYINSANAVIFLHLLKNIASGSLRKFFKKVPDRSYRNIFMCLTHKAQHTAEDVELTIEETKELFPEIRPQERIVAVDSMLKLIHDELIVGKSLKDLRKDEEKRKLIADYIVEYESDMTKIQPTVLADSNFTTVKGLLTKFSEEALVGQLSWVVKQIASGYEQQRHIYDEQIRLVGRKAEFDKAPEQFDKEIDELKSLLYDYQLRLNDFSQRKREEYKGRHSTVNKTFSTMKVVYDKLLGSAENEDRIRKHIVDFNDECDSKVTRFTTQLSKEYEAEMDQVGAEFNAEHQIYPPKISLESISKIAQERAYEEVTIQGDRAPRVIIGTLVGGLLGGIIGFALAGPVGAAIAGKAAAAAIGTTAVATTVVGTGVGASAIAVATTVVGTGVGAITVGADEYTKSTPTQTVNRFSDEKFKEALISEAKNLVISITDLMPQQAIGGLFDLYDKQFKEKLGTIIKERQNAYEQLKKDKEDAEKLRQLENGKKTVANELEKIKKLEI